MGCYQWYQSRPLPVRCGSRTNQADAGGHVTPPLGGHVTPEADEGGEWGQGSNSGHPISPYLKRASSNH
ncbi:hypothetical protein MTR_5g009825 [Medicago truncatula]|uniref:Uncharacterized protein n=1 Tax=Medicago truncatula TaxID=3880 RepID=A0A072UCU1_MEDTR|nr:hypothetical protein MTR_5g009825 [Medicago truncatula]